LTKNGDVRLRCAIEEQQDRHADADEQPRERVEHEHADERGHRREEVGSSSEAVDAAQVPRMGAIELHERGDATSSMTAAMTTAASTASGSSSNKPVKKRSVTTASTATTNDESSLFAPAPAFTAVFERLPPTTMPLERPAPMLAAPTPSSSRFASIS
jgi:hypothetical protein